MIENYKELEKWRNRSGIYFLQYGFDGLTKIGQSNNLSQRISGYRTDSNFSFLNGYLLEIHGRKYLKQKVNIIESLMHSYFREFYSHGEWFDISEFFDFESFFKNIGACNFVKFNLSLKQKNKLNKPYFCAEQCRYLSAEEGRNKFCNMIKTCITSRPVEVFLAPE